MDAGMVKRWVVEMRVEDIACEVSGRGRMVGSGAVVLADGSIVKAWRLWVGDRGVVYLGSEVDGFWQQVGGMVFEEEIAAGVVYMHPWGSIVGVTIATEGTDVRDEQEKERDSDGDEG